MGRPIIEVNNVGKKFCKSLKRSMFYGMFDVASAALGLSPDSARLRRDEFWALEGLSFDLNPGEIIGIIGANGSGKSTLLKLLTGIYMPDRGEIRVRGKVGAMIEVGAGFHPMLSGRENIYMNGAILGMTRKEINAKFDSIVDFADIGDFLDAPVKHYSSGMFVRLGFAIAVHCEPDILLVDEILSVGDAAFRRRSSERMHELIRKGDCAIVLVSHNMQLVEAIARRAILLHKGKVLAAGTAREVVPRYDLLMRKPASSPQEIAGASPQADGALRKVQVYDGYSDNSVCVHGVWLERADGGRATCFLSDEPVSVCVAYELAGDGLVTGKGYIWVAFINEGDVNCMGARVQLGEEGLPEELPCRGVLRVTFSPLQLATSVYKISIHFFDHTFTAPYSSGHYGYIQVAHKVPANIPGVNSPVCWPSCRWRMDPPGEGRKEV
jgi:ABC-type polysaccharide/polyol phosphate transport system ATPase subunit